MSALRDILRELYRRNITTWSPKQWGIRRIYGRAQYMRQHTPYYVKGPSDRDVKRWWRWYWRNKQESSSPKSVYEMLLRTKKEKGFALPKQEARRISSYIARRGGVPSKTEFPQYYHTKDIPSLYGSLHRHIVRYGKFTPKQRRLWERHWSGSTLGGVPSGKYRFKFGQSSGKVPIDASLGHFDRQKLRALREAKKDYLTREIPQYKRVAGGIASSVLAGEGLYQYEKKKNRNTPTAVIVGKIQKSNSVNNFNMKLLRGLLYSGFVMAGVGGLAGLLRSGQRSGLYIPVNSIPNVRDSSRIVSTKINNIVSSSNVTPKTVSSVMSGFNKLPSGSKGSNPGNMETRLKQSKEDRIKLIRDRQARILRERERVARETEQYDRDDDWYSNEIINT